MNITGAVQAALLHLERCAASTVMRSMQADRQRPLLYIIYTPCSTLSHNLQVFSRVLPYTLLVTYSEAGCGCDHRVVLSDDVALRAAGAEPGARLDLPGGTSHRWARGKW